MSRTTFIYALIDPRDQCVRYVGKSDNPTTRFAGHLNPNTQATSAKHKWVAELTKAHLRPELLVLAEVPTDEWEQHERAWIQFYGKTLTNGTEGGRTGWKRCAPAHVPLTHRVVELPPEELEELRGASKELIMEAIRRGMQYLRLEQAMIHPDRPEISLEEIIRRRSRRYAVDARRLQKTLTKFGG